MSFGRKGSSQVRKASHRGSGDPELQDLFADDAEALAIVDAIRDTAAHPPRRKRPIVFGAIAAVLITALAFATLTRNSSRAGVIERALTVLPANRVIHMVLEDERPSV